MTLILSRIHRSFHNGFNLAVGLYFAVLLSKTVTIETVTYCWTPSMGWTCKIVPREAVSALKGQNSSAGTKTAALQFNLDWRASMERATLQTNIMSYPAHVEKNAYLFVLLKALNSTTAAIEPSSLSPVTTIHDYHGVRHHSSITHLDSGQGIRDLDVTYQILVGWQQENVRQVHLNLIYASKDAAKLDETDPIDGQMFIAARIQWQIPKVEILPNNEGLYELTVVNDVTKVSIVHEINIMRSSKKKQFKRFVDAIVLMENALKLGENYTITVIKANTKWIKSLAILAIETVAPGEVICDAANILKNRPTAARWVTGLKTYVNPVYRRLTVELTKAPAQFCFEQYEVTLFVASYIHLKSIVISSSITDSKSNQTNIARVIFNDLPSDQNITVQVLPIERQKDTDICLCLLGGSRCGCVTALSQPIFMANYQIIIPKSYQSINTFNEQIQSRQRVPLEDVIIIFTLLMLLLLTGVVVVILLLRRNSQLWVSGKLFNKRNVILQPGKTSNHVSLKPLINEAKNETVWILPSNSLGNENLLKLAYDLMQLGVEVSCPMFDVKEIEIQKHHYILRNLFSTNKIILFHGYEADELLSGTNQTKKSHYHDISTDIYTTVTAMLKINDPRILHVKPEFSKMTVPFVETIFELPRDSEYLFNALGIDQTTSSNTSTAPTTRTSMLSIAELNPHPQLTETVIDELESSFTDSNSIAPSSNILSINAPVIENLTPLEIPETISLKKLYQKMLPHQSNEDDSGVHSL